MEMLMHICPGRSAAIAVASAAMLLAGCVAPRTHTQADLERGDCPGDMRMQCSHRTAEPTICACVSAGEMENTIEELMRNPDPAYRQ
jgi:hypothetical protein